MYVLDFVPPTASLLISLPGHLQTEHDADPSRLLLTAPLVLSYLILDDVYAFGTSSFGFPLNLRDQPSGPVRVNPSPSTASTPPPNRGTL